VFGVDFSELMVIMVIALIVIGPERLPKVARTLGMMWARAQRYINGVKADLARDMAAEELRELHLKVQQEAREAEKIFKERAQAASQSIEQQVRELNSAIAEPVQPVTEKKPQELPAAPGSGQEKDPA
jgi:sec-independent protein translocase protein TatB